MKFAISPVVPAARGHVKAKKDLNGNYSIKIRVTHLASPDRLTPSKKYYLAWLTSSDRTNKLGQLRSSSGMFSKTLKASLNTVSVVKPKRVFVTAENNNNITDPGEVIVLDTKKK